MKAELASITEELRRAEREVQLITELIRVRSEDGDAASGGPSAPIVTEPPDSAADIQEPRLAEAVVEVLRRHGKAMHIQELTAAVRRAGIPIPGRGESANLIAHIRPHPEVVRPVRGVYGLREWGIEEAVPRPRPRRRRRRSTRGTAARKADRRPESRGLTPSRATGGGK